MRQIKHFIWDFDGTLFDTYPLITSSFQSALLDCGVSEEKSEIYSHLMKSIPETMEFYRQKYHLDDTLAARYHEYMKSETPENCRPFPSVIQFCRRVSESGKHNYIFTHRGESTFRFLKAYEMLPLFTDIVTIGQGFQRKPDPEALNYLIDKYRMLKEESLMVGDRQLDILCGKNAGIHTCYITNGFPDNQIFADYRFNSIREMNQQFNILPKEKRCEF